MRTASPCRPQCTQRLSEACVGTRLAENVKKRKVRLQWRHHSGLPTHQGHGSLDGRQRAQRCEQRQEVADHRAGIQNWTWQWSKVRLACDTAVEEMNAVNTLQVLCVVCSTVHTDDTVFRVYCSQFCFKVHPVLPHVGIS